MSLNVPLSRIIKDVLAFIGEDQVALKVFTRSDAVGGVVRQKWKSIYPEFLECPRGPID